MDDRAAGGAGQAPVASARLSGEAPPPSPAAVAASAALAAGWLVVGTLFGGGAWAVAPEVGLYPSLGLYGLLATGALCALAGPTLRALWAPTRAALAVGLMSGALMAAVTWLVYPVAAAVVPGVREAVAELYGAAAVGPPPIVRLMLLGVIVLAEEALWRGVLLTGLRARLGRRAAVLGAAIVYGLAQLGSGSLALVLLAVACGIVWGAQRLWHGSLVVPFLTHLVWDLGVLVVRPVEAPAPFWP